MSATSSTAKTSKSSEFTSTFSPSSSSFFFAKAFFTAGSLKSFCFFFHEPRLFVQSDHLLLNHSEGCKSSIRCVSFLSSTHLRKCSSHFAFSAHANLISSKPSSSSGRVNLAYHAESSFVSRSGASLFRKFAFFSSSVSSTLIGSSASSSAGASFFSSSSASFSNSSSASFFPSLDFLVASSFLFRSSWIFFFFSSSAFLRVASAFLRLASASALARLSFSVASWTHVLYSAGGSPMTTWATLLNSGPPKRISIAFRSSAVRFPFTCMIT
mmetsp:Transcript_128239/g.356940  ORF Transcript_128239/g.356940 Transcript_128239/m.356940 type:complete len:270 (+) Transcript_128239:173-982(+)